jgi:hypothetical protein
MPVIDLPRRASDRQQTVNWRNGVPGGGEAQKESETQAPAEKSRESSGRGGILARAKEGVGEPHMLSVIGKMLRVERHDDRYDDD